MQKTAYVVNPQPQDTSGDPDDGHSDANCNQEARRQDRPTDRQHSQMTYQLACSTTLSDQSL